MIDHLFRHHYGKMVSVLTRIFGLAHLEMIEDAIQDTFIKALSAWRDKPPENPEAWLTAAAKNRTLDLFRKLSAERKRVPTIQSASDAMAVSDLFLDTEVADSQLRMIFAACHPSISASERIAFSLKTISGFSSKEIASALLTKEETIKKRLTRARQKIQEEGIEFNIPVGAALMERLRSVHQVLYLIFNEGLHSGRVEVLIRKELCGEAMRLCQVLLQNKIARSHDGYALFALMCFHSSRMESRVNDSGAIVDLKHQDRDLWHFPLIQLGNDAMHKAVDTEVFSTYHYEAAIAAEHLKARTFEATRWDKILDWYLRLHALQPSAISALNIAVVQLQLENYEDAYDSLLAIEPKDLGQRAYIYYATLSDYYDKQEEVEKALSSIHLALATVKNEAEKDYLLQKKLKLEL